VRGPREVQLQINLEVILTVLVAIVILPPVESNYPPKIILLVLHQVQCHENHLQFNGDTKHMQETMIIVVWENLIVANL